MTETREDLPQDGTPDSLVADFQAHREQLDQRLGSLEQLVANLRQDLQGDSQASLQRLAETTQELANGRASQEINLEAKGELGVLLANINQTLLNLQQLDAAGEHQGDQAPELAAELDAITSDAEEATQSIMNRLDSLMAAADDATQAMETDLDNIGQLNEHQSNLHAAMAGYLDRAAAGEDQNTIAQEVLEYLFAHQMAPLPAAVDFAPAITLLRKISDEASGILKILQTQDITRQKIEQVALLLNQFQGGLNRLRVIFDIPTGEDPAL